ncbi:MAG: hypothetical protein ACC742_13860 [Thermoanaerobaculales bacterium]
MMELPRAEDRRSSQQQGTRGRRAGRMGLNATLTLLVVVVGAVPAHGGEPPGAHASSTVSEEGGGT